jgi:hypothetical protein
MISLLFFSEHHASRRVRSGSWVNRHEPSSLREQRCVRLQCASEMSRNLPSSHCCCARVPMQIFVHRALAQCSRKHVHAISGTDRRLCDFAIWSEQLRMQACVCLTAFNTVCSPSNSIWFDKSQGLWLYFEKIRKRYVDFFLRFQGRAPLWTLRFRTSRQPSESGLTRVAE